MGKRPIVIAGFPRGGTTWVGRVVGSARAVALIEEPFNANREPPMGIAGWPFGEINNLYLASDAAARYEESMDRLLRGRSPVFVRSQSTRDGDEPMSKRARLRQSRLVVELRSGCSVPLIKDPHGWYMLPWMHERFGADCVLLVRHPAGVLAGYQRLGWDCRPHQYLERSSMCRDLLGPSGAEELLRQHDPSRLDRDERVLLDWCVRVSVLNHWRRLGRPWHIVRYEDLAERPAESFGELFRRFGLRPSRATGLRIREAVGAADVDESALGEGHRFDGRNSRAACWSWADRLSEFDIRKTWNWTGELAARLGYSSGPTLEPIDLN